MALLNLNGIGKRTGGKWALWDVCLELNAGELLGIFGRSGSGKSALARTLAGLDTPTNGTITLGDRDNEGPVTVSLALSSPACAPELTIYENLHMFAALSGMPGRKRVKEITFLLELLGLGEWRGVRASQVPQGALKRLELARALLADAQLLVIDSLLDGLDPDTFERFWDYLASLRRNDLKAVLVLTSSGRVAEVCPRVAVIHRGRIGFTGRPDDFRRLAGEDVVVLGGVDNAQIRNRIQEQFSLVIKEEDGFLSFRVGNGERMASDLLSEFGSELSCVYLKRPTLEDALDVLASGGTSITASTSGRTSG